MLERLIHSCARVIWVLIMASGCATGNKTASSDEIEAPPIIGTHYTTIVFDNNTTRLTRESKHDLKALVDKAHKEKRSIQEIRILAWSDKEYPEKNKTKASTTDIILASKRAQSIRDFLEKDLDETEDIDSFNMARRPDFLSRILKDDEYEVKEAFDISGATGSRLPDGSVSFTKASKALVIIDYEGDEDNLK